MKIRFVGGLMHNRLIDVADDRPVFEVQTSRSVSLLDGIGESVDPGYFTIETYYLHAYVTAYGTRFVQFVHRDTNFAAEFVYSESFNCSRFESSFDGFLRELLKACDRCR